jgi:hypothetical protein
MIDEEITVEAMNRAIVYLLIPITLKVVVVTLTDGILLDLVTYNFQ